MITAQIFPQNLLKRQTHSEQYFVSDDGNPRQCQPKNKSEGDFGQIQERHLVP